MSVQPMPAHPSAAQAAATPRVVGDLFKALVFATVVGTCGGALAALIEFERRPLTLDGVALPRHGDPELFIHALAADWYDTEITLDAGSQVLRATRSELGGELDVDAAVAEARLARGDGPPWSRLHAFATQQSGALVWQRRVDERKVRAFAETLRGRVTIDPVPLGRDGRGGRPGLSLSLLGATRAITDALHRDDALLRLPVQRLAPPNAAVGEARHARYGAVVAAHETRYAQRGEQAGRARNIEIAASALDGAVIEPRAELSFNDVVGERTFERGYEPAIELARGGRRTEGIGGGVCQVAATLHAAAFFGAFEILEHHPHTRNSSYIAAGLDAAISWPHKDLRIRNPYNFHVRVRATAYRGTLRIELMGARRGPRVEWDTEILRRIHRQTEREVDRRLPLGAQDVLDEGEDGSVMERTRTLHWSDGAVTETERLRYPPVHRLVRVGPERVRPSMR